LTGQGRHQLAEEGTTVAGRRTTILRTGALGTFEIDVLDLVGGTRIWGRESAQKAREKRNRRSSCVSHRNGAEQLLTRALKVYVN
jgi:hypothetical protein